MGIVRLFLLSGSSEVIKRRKMLVSKLELNLSHLTFHCSLMSYKREGGGFPGGAVVENLPANAGDTGSSPGLGGSHMPRSN